MVKVGDKVRVTVRKYPQHCPLGTICTVASVYSRGGIDATVDGGDVFKWYFAPGEYEPITEPTEPAPAHWTTLLCAIQETAAGHGWEVVASYHAPDLTV